MKTKLTNVMDGSLRYQALKFWCPGCERVDKDGERHAGLHMLPVNNGVKKPSWEFDGNLELPTLSPSILTKRGDLFVCHSFLKKGVFEFLSDCTHQYANQHVPIPDLPDWCVRN